MILYRTEWSNDSENAGKCERADYRTFKRAMEKANDAVSKGASYVRISKCDSVATETLADPQPCSGDKDPYDGIVAEIIEERTNYWTKFKAPIIHTIRKKLGCGAELANIGISDAFKRDYEDVEACEYIPEFYLKSISDWLCGLGFKTFVHKFPRALCVKI